MRRGVFGILVGCAGSAHAPPPPPPPLEFAVEVTAPAPTPESAQPGVTLDQPPAVKLKLGHYRSARRGIGVVIDLTQHEAKLRFDSTSEVLNLDPSPGSLGRTDYFRTAHQVVLQVWEDNRMVVYVPGGDGTGLDVVRDGDAEPL